MSWPDTDEIARQYTQTDDAAGLAQDALSKMARAHKRGTGCHLSANEIFALSITSIGELWAQDDPRKA